jgi:tetratricopeptide (TPR) repeat protein
LRTFFLFYLLSYVLRNPLLALLIAGAVFYFFEARHSGRYFNPGSFFSTRNTLKDLQKTVEVNPHNVAAHNDLGRLLADAGKFDQALGHMEQAIARMPESPEANYYYGLCLLKEDRGDEALEYMERALEINPRFLYGVPQVELAKAELTRGNAGAAAEWARKAVKLNTSSVEGWLTLARAEKKSGNAGEAASAYASATNAYGHLPHYLKLASRSFAREAKREAKA